DRSPPPPARPRRNAPQARPFGPSLPRPQIAEPERRQEMYFGRLRAAVMNNDLDQDIFRRFLGILDEDVEVPVVVEDSRVEQLVFRLVPPALPACLDEIGIGIGLLRILVEILHVRVRRSTVEVEVVLFYVLAVVALAVGESEQPLLQDRVFPVPEGQRETEPLVVVGNPRQAVFPPAVGARPGLVVREIIPGVAPFAVVFTH